MKKIIIFLFTISFFALSCGKESPATQIFDHQNLKSEGVDFIYWADNIKPEHIEEMYLNAPKIMSDVRSELIDIRPFSYEDIIFQENVDGPNTYYPCTRNIGMSIVRFQDSIIFENSWNNGYMDQDKTMTIIEYGFEYGKNFNFQLLRITNESRFPPSPGHPNGSYGRENKLYIYNADNLFSVNLQSIGIPYYFGAIKKAPIEGVIILYGVGFPRAYPQYKYFVLYDLETNLHKTFILPY